MYVCIYWKGKHTFSQHENWNMPFSFEPAAAASPRREVLQHMEIDTKTTWSCWWRCRFPWFHWGTQPCEQGYDYYGGLEHQLSICRDYWGIMVNNPVMSLDLLKMVIFYMVNHPVSPPFEEYVWIFFRASKSRKSKKPFLAKPSKGSPAASEVFFLLPTFDFLKLNA